MQNFPSFHFTDLEAISTDQRVSKLKNLMLDGTSWLRKTRRDWHGASSKLGGQSTNGKLGDKFVRF